jgi:hypothetical protein
LLWILLSDLFEPLLQVLVVLLLQFRVRTEGTASRSGVPRALFESIFDARVLRNRYVVSADGQRFLVIGPAEDPAPTRSRSSSTGARTARA